MYPNIDKHVTNTKTNPNNDDFKHSLEIYQNAKLGYINCAISWNVNKKLIENILYHTIEINVRFLRYSLYKRIWKIINVL